MNDDKELRKNASGYSDPTAYEAIKNADKAKLDNLLHVIFYICKLAGFRVEGRIVLVEEKTGKVWR